MQQLELNDLSLDTIDLWKSHNEEYDNSSDYTFLFFAINTLSFFIAFGLSLIILFRHLNHTMKKQVSFNEVLGIMRSGDSHYNLYSEHGAHCKHEHDTHLEHAEEMHNLLHAHDHEQEELQAELDEEDQESMVSFYYEDAEGNVQKKMVKRKVLD